MAITATVAANAHADNHGNAPNYLTINSPTAMRRKVSEFM